MSLKSRYILVLNGIIMAMWILYTVWTLRETERQFMKSEMNSITHLAIGLGLLFEHQLENHDSIVDLQTEIASLLPSKSGLDIMVIDSDFEVKLATQPELMGKRWFEETIRDVLQGRTSKFEVVVSADEHRHEDRRAIDATIAVRSPTGEISHAVHVAKWLDHVSGALTQQLVSHGLFALAMLVIIGVSVNLLTYRVIIKPLKTMNLSLIESGWLSKHPELLRGSELDRLQAVLDDALTRIADHTTDLNQRLKRSERLAVIGQMASMLAHEIRNPMHIIRGAAETICRRFPESSEFAGDIREEVDRVARLIEELLDYARDTPPRLEQVNASELLSSVADRVIKSSRSEGSREGLSIRIQPSEVCLAADPVMLAQALTNLLINAIEASESGQPIEMRAVEVPGDEVRFEIADAGVGISEEDLERAAEPFFSRKSQGYGLGLAVVDKIADLHGGTLYLQRRAEKGTAANLILPIRQEREPI